MVIAGFLLAVAMRRTAGWAGLARVTRWFMAAILVFTVCDGVFSASAGGLFERLLHWPAPPRSRCWPWR